MQSKHTPGPWRIAGGMSGNAGYISSDYGYVPIRTPFVEGAHADRHGGATEEALANARLIAAAPTLYDHARYAAAQLDAIRDRVRAKDKHLSAASLAFILDELATSAREALAGIDTEEPARCAP